MPQIKKFIVLPTERVVSKIFIIHGKKVMPDMDLAELYGVETKQLKRAVRRNMERFPDDFMFEIGQKEFNSLRCQNGTLKRGQNIKYQPFAFTEHGVAMLSTVLKSKRAIQVNILDRFSFRLTPKRKGIDRHACRQD